MSINPYHPTLDESPEPSPDPKRRTRFAGWWLAAVGLLHLVAVNVLPSVLPLSQWEWSPLTMVLLGVLVVLRFRVAIVLARFIGSMMIVGLVMLGVLILVGFNEAGAIRYGRLTIDEPTPLQSVLLLAFVYASFVPSWWSLQRAIADEPSVLSRRDCGD